MTSGSPAMTMRPAKRSRASSAHRSGPMPAGSPAVRTTSLSLVVAVLDEGAVTGLAQPVLEGFVGLARADGLARRHLLAIFGELVRASLDDLHQVPSEGRLDGLAHLLVGQRVHRALELRHRIARRDPAQVTALLRAGVLGMQARELGEIGARHDALAQSQQAL